MITQILIRFLILTTFFNIVFSEVEIDKSYCKWSETFTHLETKNHACSNSVGKEYYPSGE